MTADDVEPVTWALAEMGQPIPTDQYIQTVTWIREAEDPVSSPKRAELPLKIEVTAMDHPGIVQSVVHILRRHDVNIESLNTQVTKAPLSGAPIFGLVLEAGVPAEKSIARIKEELSDLAAEMNLDLNFPR